MGKKKIATKEKIVSYIRLFLASMVMGAGWGILVRTPLIYLPVNGLLTFLCALVAIFIKKRISPDKLENYKNYFYDTGIRTLSVMVSLATIALAFTSFIFTSNLPETFNLVGVAGSTISKGQLAAWLITASSNFIGMLEILIVIYALGFIRFFKWKKEIIEWIDFISLWLFIILIFLFIINLTTILGTMRTILYSAFLS